jgi:starch synthase
MIPEVLGDSGMLVEPGDPGALAGALQRMLDDPAMAAALGRRARARCEAEYSFAVARARLFPLIDALLAARQSARPQRDGAR